MRRVLKCLRLILLLQCTGYACSLLLISYEHESPIYGTLLFEWGWPETLAQRIDDGGTWLYFLAAVAAFCLPLLGGAKDNEPAPTRQKLLRKVEIAALLWIFFWQLALAIAKTYRGGEFMSAWALGSQAIRYVLPLAILWISSSRVRDKTNATSVRVGIGMLALATAATFTVHGLEAYFQQPSFQDLIYGTAGRVGWDISPPTVSVLLRVIGIVDILAAMLLLLTELPICRRLARLPGIFLLPLCFRPSIVLGYMALWGLATSLSRITAAGFGGFGYEFPEVLFRAANWGVPLALLLHVRMHGRETEGNKQSNHFNSHGPNGATACSEGREPLES